jgi:acetyltransferase
MKTIVAESPEDAVKAAEEIGYPVVLKLFSETITHKTDVGGVKLNLRNPQAVTDAFVGIKESVTEKVGAEHFQGVTVQKMVRVEGYELILGSSIDAQFGPVLLFGTGGQLVEVFKDSALALPPLNTTLARRMMEHTKIFKALKGVRGRKPCDLEALDHLLVRFSQLVAEQKWIKEIDINPLMASSDGFLALDARVVVFDKDTPAESLPKLAIRPYPIKYVKPWQMKDGMNVTIRPIRPEDEPLLIRFHENLSETTVYRRYLHVIKFSQRVAHERLTRICFNDYDREIALVADYRHALTGEHHILAVARLSKMHGGNDAEFAMVVADEYQCSGLGTEMLQRLIQVARDEKLDKIVATILPDNLPMQRVCTKIGFEITQPEGEDAVMATLQL